MPPDAREVYRFTDFTLDPVAYELRRGARSVRLERQPMELLILLVRRHGQLVLRSEISDRLWGKDIFVDVETGIHTVIRKIRLALRDSADAPEFVATVPGKGYRFIAPVEVVAGGPFHQPAPAFPPVVAAIPEHPQPAGPGPIRSNEGSDPGLTPLPRRRAAASWVGLVAVVGVFAFLWFGREPEDRTRELPALATDNRLVPNLPGSAGGPSFSPDGQMIAYHSGPDFTLWVQRLDGGDPLRLAAHEDGASFPVWTSKGDRILYTSTRGIMWVSPLGGPSTLLIESAGNPSFSADGETLAFESGPPNPGIYVAHPDGTNRRRIVARSGASGPATATISPDGRRVAFVVHERPGVSDLWVASIDGDSPRRLTFDRTEVGRPVWTPDGEDLLFHSSRGGSQTIWGVPAGGGEPRPVTTGAGQDRNPGISPDGRRLVYQNIRFGSALSLYDPRSGSRREILEAREALLHPRFSPSGNEVVYFAKTGAAFSMFTVGLDGRGRRQVGSGLSVTFPRWSSDGQTIYFLTETVPSLMKVGARGGQPAEVRSWNEWRDGWSTAANPMEIDPAGRIVVYSRLMDGQAQGTSILDVSTGGTIAATLPLVQFRWTRDGRWIVGTHVERPDDPGARRIVVCAPQTGACRTVAEGFFAVPDPDGSRIWFLRPPIDWQLEPSLWSVPFTGGDAAAHGELRTLRGREEDVAFDVSSNGNVVHSRHTEGIGELWVADLN